MGTKIKQLEITGLRGVKEKITLQMNAKSFLIYGDNGTGKSSISDVVEWYYTDTISHLASGEIDVKEALRNSSLKETDASSISLVYNKANLDNKKQLNYKRGKLISENSNKTEELTQYLAQSKKENLILRYQLLREFIAKTKGEKLIALSNIIGYSEVTKVKEILKKAFSSIKTDIKNQNYETQINTQKLTLVDKIGAAVSREEDLFERIGEIIKPYDIELKIDGIDDLDKILDKLKTPVNYKLTETLSFIRRCQDSFKNLQKEIELIDQEYTKYFSEFEIISNDIESIMQTFLAELLNAGKAVLIKKYYKEESCHLCLLPKSQEDLKKEIEHRLKEIEESTKKKESFDVARNSLVTILTDRIKKMDIILADLLINEDGHEEIKKACISLKVKLLEYQSAGNESVTSGSKIKKPSELILRDIDFSVIEVTKKRIEEIEFSMKSDGSTILYSNISASKDAFLKIKKFEDDKSVLEVQKKSLELIKNEFVKRQKEGLENFIENLSDKINDYYQFMNPGELFQEIKIVTIGEEDELDGITIEYKFDDKLVSPPQKYFSESHLNCFGIAYFLASVIAFNKENKFIILDDVISSFDTNHRKRFADLLFEKFNDWQIILLTHEEEWYQYVKQLAKKNSWLITEIKWSDIKGTYLEENTGELKELIEKSIATGEITFIGNPIRKYLERILKDICYNLDVKVSFRFNEVNEKRMPDELLCELKAKINKHSAELKLKISVLDRIASSAFLGNLLSHDNLFKPKIGDIIAFWKDILEFEKIFICQEPSCKNPKVSVKNYDSVKKKIRCGCDSTKYDWTS